MNSAVVAHEDEAGQQVLERGRAAGAHRQERRRAQIEDEKVRRLAGLETAGLGIERECARAAERGQIPEVKRTQRDVLHLLHFVRVSHRVEERWRGSGADVAAEADDHACIENAMERKESAAEEEIGVRTMRDACAAARKQIELFRSEPHAMREDRTLAEQAVAVIHIRVLRLREKL